MDARRPDDVLALVPASTVDDEDDALRLARSHGLREVLERDVEGGDVHRREEQPLDASRGRTNEAVDVEPFVAEMLFDEGAMALFGPDASRGRLQSDARFVLGPDLDDGFRDDGLDILDERPDFFLKASWASTSAEPCCVCGCCSE